MNKRSQPQRPGGGVENGKKWGGTRHQTTPATKNEDLFANTTFCNSNNGCIIVLGGTVVQVKFSKRTAKVVFVNLCLAMEIH